MKLQRAPASRTSKPYQSCRKRWNLPRHSMNTILRRSMSRFSIANLPRMEAAALSEELLALKSPDNSIAVIDVRDGGTQIHSLHAPFPRCLLRRQHAADLQFFPQTT